MVDKSDLEKPDGSVRVVEHQGQTWIYEKVDLEQGAYSICNPSLERVVAILPQDRSRSIEDGENARLLIRHYGSNEFVDRGVYTLVEAMTQGNEHVRIYRTHESAFFLIAERQKDERETPCIDRSNEWH